MIRHPNSPHGRVSNENGRQDLPISSTPVVDLPGAVVPAHGQRCQSRDHGHAAAPHLHHTFRHFRPFNSTTCARNPSKDRPPHVNLESDRPNYAVLPGARARASISKSRSSICTLTCFTSPYRLRRRRARQPEEAVIPSVPAFPCKFLPSVLRPWPPYAPTRFSRIRAQFCTTPKPQAAPNHPRNHNKIQSLNTKLASIRKTPQPIGPVHPSLCPLPAPPIDQPARGRQPQSWDPQPSVAMPEFCTKMHKRKASPNRNWLRSADSLASPTLSLGPSTLFGHMTRSRQVIAAFRQRTRRLAQVGGGIRRAQLVRIAAQHLERKIKW